MVGVGDGVTDCVGVGVGLGLVEAVGDGDGVFDFTGLGVGLGVGVGDFEGVGLGLLLSPGMIICTGVVDLTGKRLYVALVSPADCNACMNAQAAVPERAKNRTIKAIAKYILRLRERSLITNDMPYPFCPFNFAINIAIFTSIGNLSLELKMFAQAFCVINELFIA